MHIAATLLLFLSPSAQAVVYGGNPELSFHVSWPGEALTDGAVELGEVVVHKCLGGYLSWSPGIPINPVQGWSMSLPNGNYCAITLEWDTVMELEGDDFTVEYAESSTTIWLTGTTQTAVLSPWEETAGVVYGGNPELVLTID